MYVRVLTMSVGTLEKKVGNRAFGSRGSRNRCLWYSYTSGPPGSGFLRLLTTPGRNKVSATSRRAKRVTGNSEREREEKGKNQVCAKTVPAQPLLNDYFTRDLFVLDSDDGSL
jgi:hypothetical protein